MTIFNKWPGRIFIVRNLAMHCIQQLHSTTAYKRDLGWTVVVHRMGFFQALGNEDRDAMLYASTQRYISRVNHSRNICFYIKPFLRISPTTDFGTKIRA